MTTDILKTYLRRLTKLSTRNRSLLLTNLPAEQFLDWQELDFVDNRSSFDLLKEVISQKKSFRLCPMLDSRSEKVNEISKRLRKIARTERFIEEECGSEDLYVAYPFVRGKLMDGTVIHAPLAFFPVTLNADNASESNQDSTWQLQRRDEPASLNRSFLLAYGHFNQVKISEELLEKSLDELSRDSLAFRTELYELLKGSPLEINFNQELFQERIYYFDAQSKPDLELLERNGELKLYPEAVLGIFPQAGSYLGPDYENLINLASESLVPEEGFFNFPTTEIIGNGAVWQSGEVNTFTAFPQDASQEEALIRVKLGESLVVQGPPGTGKSQLIANLMTDFAARGKRVLLVCQKRVALDVVYERLKQVAFTPFVALVHDFKNDRAALYGQLATQIENIEAYQKQNYSLDAIVLERQFLQTSRTIEQTSNELQEFKSALFDTNDCGLSPKELYLTSNPSALSVALPQFRSFRFDDKLEDFAQKLNRYEQYQHQVSVTHPWYDRVSFVTVGFQEISDIKVTIEEVAQWGKTTAVEIEQLLKRQLTIEKILAINGKNEAINNWLQSLAPDLVWNLFKKRKEGFFNKEFNQWFRDWSKNNERLQQGKMLGDEVVSSELLLFSNRLDQLITVRKSLFKWLFYGDKNYFRGIAEKYGLTLGINDLYQLKQLLHNRLEWETLLKELEERMEVSILSAKQSTSASQLQEFLNHFAVAEKACLDLERNYEFFTNLIDGQKHFAGFQKSVKSLLYSSKQTTDKHHSWQQYLTKNQIQSAVDDSKFTSELHAFLDRDFDVLVEADKLKESFTIAESEIIESLDRSLSLIVGTDRPIVARVTLFQNSLRLAWLSHLEEKYPILRSVSSLKINQLEQELQGAILKKQELSREIMLIQLREQTYKDIEFNRLQNRITYRDLQHQVTKKRKIWPVRKLIDQHSDEVFRLVPCWLASPETVSAVFPLAAGLFDLVIFDEASQCYAEYGIPAIYRAQQTVIVGDSKQLTPYDLYRVRYEDENEEEKATLEVESLLDLAKHYLPETLLQGHYRSRTLDLIDFSNQHFYKNKLQLLPDFRDINSPEPAIKYVKVEGVWEKNRNVIEAEKVMELIQELQKTQPNSSVGIVTFNQPQQQLIESLNPLIPNGGTTIPPLGGRDGWCATATDTSERPRGLFIKNIENVQGDERDIIIFSVGYAPDVRGKLRSQFGSLNAQGGENRLNVAITRARHKVYVVTSILPEQLQVEETLHIGPKLLKKYLQYALDVSEGRYMPTPFVSEKYQSKWLLKNQLLKNGSRKDNINSDELQTLNQKLYNELPFADLSLKNEEYYESVILTDDDLYQQAISVKESHAYLPLQLRAKGWSFERIWSRVWWRGR